MKKKETFGLPSSSLIRIVPVVAVYSMDAPLMVTVLVVSTSSSLLSFFVPGVLFFALGLVLVGVGLGFRRWLFLRPFGRILALAAARALLRRRAHRVHARQSARQ